MSDLIPPPPRRKKRGPKARAGIFLLHGGRCHLCGKAILATDKWELEHIHAIGLGGLDIDDNLRPAHIKCHKVKTHGSPATSYGSDRHAMAKFRRILLKWGPADPSKSVLMLKTNVFSFSNQEEKAGGPEGGKGGKGKRKWPKRPWPKKPGRK